MEAIKELLRGTKAYKGIVHLSDATFGCLECGRKHGVRLHVFRSVPPPLKLMPRRTRGASKRAPSKSSVSGRLTERQLVPYADAVKNVWVKGNGLKSLAKINVYFNSPMMRMKGSYEI
eukprot:CAMPEP_0113852054 /NCGR_PEP_ID=MMETSP0372-20130328/5173_1 /TAXON_ID=340204 /ORGANISM="Lankesteria abbotti" /LENGTH=117 /DNA_ID=CAMNT_0000823313 /DNA_START=195 /DNA_END=548 /DNA_ORIENTATION=- /assembly_acc=CAM_ASM_000359